MDTEKIKELNRKLLEDIPSIKSKELFDYVEEKRREIKVITVKFTTLDQDIFTQSYFENIKIAGVKEVLREVFNVPLNIIVLTYNGEIVSDLSTLHDFDYGKHWTLDFGLHSNDPEMYISAKYAYKDLTVPDIITVTVTFEDGSTRDIVVEIFNKPILKPYLGGYLHKITQIEYHHGYAQTGPAPLKVSPWMKTHRDTQTYWMRNRKLDTTYSRATQMSNQETYIPSVTDVILTAGPYETADERAARLDIEGKVRIIQRYFRAWMLRKALKLLCGEYRKRVRKEIEEEEYQLSTDLKRKNRELIGKVFPRTKADFYMLYTMLENWKRKEIERIKLMSCGPSKMAEMYLLLEKEIEMLLSIEKQKEIVKRDRKLQRDIDFLKLISEPLSWNSDYKNIFIEMDTLETQKGREYYELYKAVCDRTLGTEGRLTAYLDVKISLQNHNNCDVGLEIVNLIERACILIARGMSESDLEILQKRIEATILRHLKMPECCDHVSQRIFRVKEKVMKDNLFYCERCKSYKTHDQFQIGTRTTSLKVCSSCTWTDRVMEPWMDIQPYTYLLKCIRREERRKLAHSSIAFILTEKDIHHIITQVWQSHSAISECNDIYKLRLCRFFKDQDWAPWNCILLTYEESKCHLKIRNLEEVYDQEFLNFVYNKHILSKRYFTTSIQLENYFDEIGNVERRWDEIIEKKEFIAVNSKVKIFLSCH